MNLGYGPNKIKPMVFNTFSVSQAGLALLTSPGPVSLPAVPSSYTTTQSKPSSNTTTIAKPKLTRQSKGTHLLPVLTRLLSSSENWFEIKNPEDYQYPGIFNVSHPQRLGYAPDITILPFYVREDEDFLLNDIQINKKKLRQKREVTFIIDEKEELLYYRMAPCGGVKICPVKGCSYMASTKDHKSCQEHEGEQLELTGNCPVEFIYVCPVNPQDKRRWISGITRSGDLKADNLHNHPINGPSKIPSKIMHDIKQALKVDPTLKTHDILTGDY